MCLGQAQGPHLSKQEGLQAGDTVCRTGVEPQVDFRQAAG